MRARLLLAILVVAVAAGSFLVRALVRRGPAAGPEGPAERIVSMSPSITEILFALGLGQRVVGVSRYCLYPPEAQTRTIIGGFMDPNYEAIIALKPDLVVLRESQETAQTLEGLGLKALVVQHTTVEGILDSIGAIGTACGADRRGEKLSADLAGQMAALERRTAQLPRPRVLLVAERTLGSGKIENAFVAGTDGFMSRVLELAGGRNACPETAAGFPVVSAEGILRMNPEVIVDLISKPRQGTLPREQILGDWNQLPQIEAVRRGQVYLIDEDYAFIPGPRFVQFARRLAELLHPQEGAPR